MAAMSASALQLQNPGMAAAGLPATVGTYLPPAGIDDFVLFVPDSKKTPVGGSLPHLTQFIVTVHVIRQLSTSSVLAQVCLTATGALVVQQPDPTW